MNTSPIIVAIDAEIATLKQARKLLANSPDVLTPKRGRGRPKGSMNTNSSASKSIGAKGTRTFSPEARAKIAAAQKARWAAQKKAA